MSVRLAFDRPVLVTRPRQQADNLCHLITAAGGDFLQFPALEIIASDDPTALQFVIQGLDDFAIAIFISANAVECGMKQLQAIRQWPSAVKIAVIGQRSNEELQRFGLSADYCPAEHFDSDGLLALAELQNLKDKKIIIFRGNSGRDYLASELIKRGAEVDYVEAYQRRQPVDYDVGSLQTWMRQHDFITTIYSKESLRNLMEMVGEENRGRLLECALVVVSERMMALVSDFGFSGKVVVARSALDVDVMKGIEAAQA